jgi:hypothetical protein
LASFGLAKVCVVFVEPPAYRRQVTGGVGALVTPDGAAAAARGKQGWCWQAG